MAAQPIGAGGGTVTVRSPDPSVDGLQVSVPPGPYPDTRTFAVASAPIVSHGFGESFRPISPLITVANGGGYADSLMTVTIPISLPAGAQPVAFFYDDVSQALEPVPMLAYDDVSVTICTRHFDVTGIAAGTRTAGKRSQGALLAFVAKIVVSYATGEMVDAIRAIEPVISSGYLPGTDDWEFVNNGSYLPGTRNGHCAGQNVSSYWYYFAKKRNEGARPLYCAFDSVHVSPDTLWHDNPRGYRMASATQAKMDWESLMLKVCGEYVGAQADWTWNALAVAMYLTHEPFNLGIYGISPTTGQRAGHNVTAYRVDLAARQIHVADPNHPGNQDRRIAFNGATLGPYFSALNAGNPGMDFTVIYFQTKTAVIDWNMIGRLWNSVFVNGENPGYVDYTLWGNTTPSTALGDVCYADKDTLDVSVSCRAPQLVGFHVFSRAGALLAPVSPADFAYRVLLPGLKPGDNLYGFALYASDGDLDLRWNDFRWVHVIYSPQQVRIVPESFAGRREETYQWSAVVRNRATGLQFDWDFGDGLGVVSTVDDTLMRHSFMQNGDYAIRLEVFQRFPWKKLGEASATATIVGPEIDTIAPDSVSCGMAVTIRGRHFGAASATSAVDLYGMPPESIVSWSDDQIVVIVPDEFGGGWVKVTVGAAASNLVWLEVPAPRIVSLSADSVVAGGQVAIHGRWFGVGQASAQVTFSRTAAPATVVSWSDTLIVVTVPEPDGKAYGRESVCVQRAAAGTARYDEFTVLEDVLATLHTTALMSCSLSGAMAYFSAFSSPQEQEADRYFSIGGTAERGGRIAWSGTRFSGQSSSVSDTYHQWVQIEGVVSADGGAIELLSAAEQDTAFYEGKPSTARAVALEVSGLPFAQSSYSGDVDFWCSGPDGQGFVQRAQDELYDFHFGMCVDRYIRVVWDSPTVIPGVQVRFSR